jgi:UDPglucose 6-dehydrogenase
VAKLQEEGAKIRAYDPQAVEVAKKILQDITYCDTPYQAVEDSDALIIITEWDEFKNLDLFKVKKLLKQPVIIDGRNIFDPSRMKELGFSYHGVGR